MADTVGDVGVNAILNINGVAAPAILNACSPDVQRAMRPIIVANGGNPLIGYAPSTGARSGFRTRFNLPYQGSTAFLNGALTNDPAGVPIILQFGDLGGVEIDGCLLEDLTINGAEGGVIEGSATFQSAQSPKVGVTGTAGDFSSGVYHFTDVTSYALVSGNTYTDVHNFSWSVRRTLIAYRGNSPTGRPKHLRVGHTEVHATLDWMKVDDAEANAFLPDCPKTGDVTILLTAICATPGGNLSLTAQQAFMDNYPTQTAGVEAFIMEQANYIAQLGQFAVAGT